MSIHDDDALVVVVVAVAIDDGMRSVIFMLLLRTKMILR